MYFFMLIHLYMYVSSEEIIKPKFEKGIVAWFKRWFCCGYKKENEVMAIYKKISQIDDDVWSSDV